MAPRRLDADAAASRRRDAIAGTTARPRRSRGHVRVALLSLVLLVFVSTLVGASAAEPPPSPAQHGVSVRVLSGSSFRAFSNRFRRQLRDKKPADCLSFHESGQWWRYEWCVGRHVRQFHNESLAREWSIVLGRFSSSASKSVRIQRADANDADALRDPELRGYVATQQYSDGDRAGCDAEQARAVSITYKCCVLRTNETYIEAVDESAPCAYALSVCTPVACGLLQKDQYAFGASAIVGEDERRALLATVKDMFYHAYHGYMDHAFPLDALLPLSCRGETFELGKIPMLTLIDTLDTLAILEDRREFQRAVQLVVARATFDLDTEVSVFETTIRVLGGLLSAHLFAIEPTLQLFPPGTYQNELLALAVDLADRLLPAFNTTTGIPYGTVNLRFGVPRGETPIASTAGAGSLSMEFTMLSALTGNATYATASRKAVRALFARRSIAGLLGKHIDTKTGEWTETGSGPGSNSDSFYEYLWKMYATFNDREMLDMFERVYGAVLECNRHGDWFTDVSMWSGCGHGDGVVFENLVAFWPGMEASLGNVDDAAKSMNAFYRVWRDYGFVPEQFNVLKWKPVRGAGGGARYPLRPELIESTFYMHEATQDASWLRAGAHFVHSLQKHTKTKCGYATVRDVESKELEDNMPSFFLSETCKYLYLLFNTTHFLRNGSYVFTTEAHPFPVLPAKQVEPVLLPTITETTTETTSETETETTRQRRRVCPRLAFWQPHGYQVDYEGSVVERTERCARPMSAKPSTADAAKQAVKTPVNVDDWLPLLEKQLRAQLASLGSKKQKEDDNGDHNDGEFMQRALGVGPDGSIESVPTEELMAQLNEKIRQHDLEHGHGDGDASPTLRYVNGGAKLGLFRMEQSDTLMRFTRQDTGEWLETTGLEDSRFTVLSWLPERRGLRAEPPPDDVVDDHELPLLLPRHRVYDFSHGRQHDALRRDCLLQVDVDDRGTAEQNPYKASRTSTTFAFSCVSSSFGAMPLERGNQSFPSAPLALAEPLDACVPLTGSLQGRIAIVRRGECFFETKVRNAARAGALGVVVVNDEEEDRVMVMSGAGESLDDEGEEPHEDHQQSLAVPAVMVPRRAGEWLHRQLLRTPRVTGRVDLEVQDHADCVAATHAFQEASQALASSVDRDNYKTLEERKAELAREAHPRMETGSGPLGRVTIFAPEWGVELTPVSKPKSLERQSWLLEIVEAPQTTRRGDSDADGP